ncbi:MarR family winged helix-turn-helix transcriptional regulator [Clostridiisalibacter paucivorans]|uniref:MarR family winged helix-turn-helix transcriptional regulator n=1 Tax=Clostridiisalibacter paucivorans TaxID=408753 RepID=UPI00047E3DDF|nr:MarR family transcriptional regulator [Clostridiisalibacter paucivorans]
MYDAMNESFSENVIDIEKYLRKIDYIIRLKGREILKDFNITGPQFIALQKLINKENMTIGGLSREMSLACSTVTDLVDRMEKNKLVTRIKDSNDKRVVRIRVNKNGHRLVEEVLKRRILYVNEKLKDFEEKDKEFLKKNLESLYEAMKMGK